MLLSLCEYAYAMDHKKQKPSLNFVIDNQFRVQSFSARNGMVWAKSDKEIHNECIWNALLLKAQKADLLDALMNEEPSFAFSTNAGSFVAKITPLIPIDQTVSYFIKVVAAKNPK
jgi:hypothetical protein